MGTETLYSVDDGAGYCGSMPATIRSSSRASSFPTCTLPPFGTMISFASSISICSWNCQALFQHASHDQHRARCKHAVVLKLAMSYDILCLQECHGHDGDLQRLASELPQHELHGSLHRRPGVGGVLIAVRRSKLQHAMHHEIEKGRLHYLDAVVGSSWLRIINLHLDPAKSNRDKQQAVQQVSVISRPALAMVLFSLVTSTSSPRARIDAVLLLLLLSSWTRGYRHTS